MHMLVGLEIQIKRTPTSPSRSPSSSCSLLSSHLKGSLVINKQTRTFPSFYKKNALNLSLNVLKPLLFIVQELQSVTRDDIVNKSKNFANYQSVFKNVRESATSVHKRENVE